jgi:alanine dehydrogenase
MDLVIGAVLIHGAKAPRVVTRDQLAAMKPGAVLVTSTFALTNATMPYVLKLAERGLAALHDDPGFMAGLNVRAGQVTYVPVAEAVGVDAARPDALLAA